MSDKTYIFNNEKGIPVLFSARRRELDEGGKPELVTPSSTSGPAEWGRYNDAVREAARSLDAPQEGDIKHFLNARARNPQKVDIPAFHEAVKRQRTADLVDIIDHHMRREGSLPRGARMVRIQAPRGYIRRTLRHSAPEDIAHLRHRLASIGHSPERVDNYLSDRINPDIWDQATAFQVTMADHEFDGMYFDSDDYEAEWEEPLSDLIAAIKEFKPEIHIHLPQGDQ